MKLLLVVLCRREKIMIGFHPHFNTVTIHPSSRMDFTRKFKKIRNGYDLRECFPVSLFAWLTPRETR